MTKEHEAKANLHNILVAKVGSLWTSTCARENWGTLSPAHISLVHWNTWNQLVLLFCFSSSLSLCHPPPPPADWSSMGVVFHAGGLDRTGPFCFTSTEARWLIRDGDRGGRGWKSEGSTMNTTQKRPARPWTTVRTMEVLRRCPLAIAQWLMRYAVAVSTAVRGRVTRTMSIALLFNNNLKQKKSNFRSPAPPPCSWSLLD